MKPWEVDTSTKSQSGWSGGRGAQAKAWPIDFIGVSKGEKKNEAG